MVHAVCHCDDCVLQHLNTARALVESQIRDYRVGLRKLEKDADLGIARDLDRLQLANQFLQFLIDERAH